MSRLLAIAFILFCFEIGIFLVFVPWADLWNNNFILGYIPALRPLVMNFSFRGAVSGLGVIDILIGLSELKHFFKSFKVADRAAE